MSALHPNRTPAPAERSSLHPDVRIILDAWNQSDWILFVHEEVGWVVSVDLIECMRARVAQCRYLASTSPIPHTIPILRQMAEEGEADGC